YNYKDIRKDLEKEGYKFYSDSDTEVILKSFHKWGMNSVDRFRGMFTFAIWDKAQKKLYLCRDRVGVKPLYWYYKDGLFMFASELKAFHKHPKFRKNLNIDALLFYLQYGYIPQFYSIFENTYKLEPGYFLVIDRNGNISKHQYWNVESFFIKGKQEKDKWLKKSEEDLTQELEDILTDSFKLRLVSDVPVGMFLSGGIDSSTVCALLAKEGIKLKTFTIGFYEREYNEADYAKKIAEFLGTDHTELYCSPKEASDVIPYLPDIYDEPFGDSSAIPTYLVSKLAKSKVKVSLSADGGDEQFCGYTRYWIVGERIAKFSSLPFLSLSGKILNLINPDLAYKVYSLLRPILPKWTNFRDKYIKLKNVLKEAKDVKTQYDVSNKVFLEEDLKQLFKSINRIPSNIEFLNNVDLNLMEFMMLYDIKTYHR
ncbi:asparagine synthase (glutamine-hydrolyzing), partial [Sulfurihydrogenibium sp.]|uniref:asparagine synthase (glutamine-hydrolyzing) n=1 Tax=Sulfurihydrogenibium sp. TaxID=2053621 RepID=UPI002634447E